MKLRIKNEWADCKMSCPCDGRVYTLRFLDPAMHIHWFNRGVKFPFEIIEEEPIEEPIKKEKVKK